jgi:hypothetical protein
MATGWLQFSPVGTILNPSRAASSVINAAAGDFSSLTADLASIENLRVTGSAKVNNQDVATESYVDEQISSLIGSAPTLLDTLAEISDALNNDASFAETVTNQIALKGSLSGTNTWSGDNTFNGSVTLAGANLGIRLQTNETNIQSNTTRLDNWDTSWNSFLATPALSSLTVSGEVSTGALTAPSLSLGGRDLSNNLQTLATGVASNLSAINVINSQLPTFALDSSCVHLTLNETISGTKTFTDAPIISTRPPNDNSTRASSTAYCDAGLALKANLNNPVFTGTFQAASISDNGTTFTSSGNTVLGSSSSNSCQINSSSTFYGPVSFQNNITLDGNCTLSDGGSLSVTGTSSLSGNVSIGGTLTVPSIDLGGRDLSSNLATLSTAIAANTTAITNNTTNISTNSSSISTINSQLPTFALDSSCVHLTLNETIGGTKTFTDAPIIPTQTANHNSGRAASTQYVDNAIASLIAGAPSTLDTLNEIATALQNDTNSIGTILTTMVDLSSNQTITSSKAFNSITVPTQSQANGTTAAASCAYVDQGLSTKTSSVNPTFSGTFAAVVGL